MRGRGRGGLNREKRVELIKRGEDRGKRHGACLK